MHQLAENVLLQAALKFRKLLRLRQAMCLEKQPATAGLCVPRTRQAEMRPS